MKKLVTLHMYLGTGTYNAGVHDISMHDFRGMSSCMNDKIWIGQTEQEIDFPEIDTRQSQIDSLEAQVQEERAQSQSRVNLLLERISTLKAIGHDE